MNIYLEIASKEYRCTKYLKINDEEFGRVRNPRDVFLYHLEIAGKKLWEELNAKVDTGTTYG